MSDTDGGDNTQPQPMEFSEPEKRFLENMWVGFKSPPEIDMNKVAARMNMHPRSCGNIWGKLKKKIQHNLSIDAPPGASPEITPLKATPKRKRATTGAGAASDGDEDSVSPTKKQRAPRAPRGSASKARGGASARGRGKVAAAKAAKAEADADDNDEDTPTVAPKKEEDDGGDDADAEVVQVAGEV